MSANLGNMLSMALRLALSALPAAAHGQILAQQLPLRRTSRGPCHDNVDPRGRIASADGTSRFIGRFMLEFGLLGSVFDLMRLRCVLLYGLPCRAGLFRHRLVRGVAAHRTGDALVVRTRRPFYRSRPGRLLLQHQRCSSRWPSLPYLPGACWNCTAARRFAHRSPGVLVLYVLGTGS